MFLKSNSSMNEIKKIPRNKAAGFDNKFNVESRRISERRFSQEVSEFKTTVDNDNLAGNVSAIENEELD